MIDETAEPAARRTVAECLDCDWVGADLDEARAHASKREHRGFRITTRVPGSSDRAPDELVEVHQL